MKRIFVKVFDHDGAVISRRDVTGLTWGDFAQLAEAVERRGFTYRLKAIDGDLPRFLGGAL